MFVRVVNVGLSPLKRLQNKREQYYMQRDKLISKGQLILEQKMGKEIEKMSFIHTVPGSKVNFSQTKINVITRGGMHVLKTPMVEAYYLDSYTMSFTIILVLLIQLI